MPITGSDPTMRSQVYASRGPIRSHSQPISSRATTVIATDPMTSQPICDCVSAISSRTTFMSGAIPNHAKKHRKNANHVMWNARICGVDTLNSRMRVALFVTSTGPPFVLKRRNGVNSAVASPMARDPWTAAAIAVRHRRPFPKQEQGQETRRSRNSA